MNKILFLSFFFIIFSASAAVYNVGSKLNPASIEVVQEHDHLLITCTFKAQTKFSADRNAMFNRSKADRLCRQGIFLFNKAKNGQQIDLSGITIAKQPVYDGKMVTYFFSKLNNVNMPVIKSTPETEIKAASVFENVSNDKEQSYSQNDSIIVFRYQSENNSVKVVDPRKYTPKTFKNHKEFNDFCDEQFKKIEELAETQRQQILKKFEESRNSTLNNME